MTAPAPVVRDDLLLALDGIVAACLTLRRLIEHAEEEPVTADESDPHGPCPDRDGRTHDILWVAGFTATAGYSSEQGVCRACGREFEHPAPVDVAGVSGPEAGGERP